MTQHIGIVACSVEGAALCYRTIASESAPVMGEHQHPVITIHTHPLGRYMDAIYRNDWRAIADIMLDSTRIVANAGADFAICPDNTIHQAFPLVEPVSPIPWLHIARNVASEAKRSGARCVGITGTKYLMTGPVYPDAFNAAGLEFRIPGEADRERINDIIFKELVYGVIKESSRLFFNEAINRLKADGADAVVLGCTEIPLLVRPDDCPLPSFDSTRLLARAAIRRATEAELSEPQ
ncbi:MAG: amino acid racemase [Planctomycetota bacterium]